MERPETMVLVESSLYKGSWEEAFTAFFTSQGMHFASLNITTTSDGSGTTLGSIEQTLAHDLSDLSESAYTVLVARGPIQSLVAQYYLESLPLVGLVLVDPLILQNDGRGTGTDERWSDSTQSLLKLLDDHETHDKANVITQKSSDLEPPLTALNKTETSATELGLLQSLPSITNPRPLELEPSSVPILVLYSSHHKYQDHYQKCAKSTARFHSFDYDNASVLEIAVKSDVGSAVEDDLDWVTEKVFEWYNEFVA